MTKHLFILFPILAFAIYQNSSDLVTIGVDNYFPSTNDDTFNYLSQIDYLVTRSGAQQITYPAGFTSNYPGVIRLAVCGLTANWLALTGWETHVVFFLTIRCMIFVSTVGIYAITLTFGQSFLPAIIATLLFSLSNFLMHQVLQQFLSSTIGIPVTLCLVLLSVVYPSTTRQARPYINVVISFFCGVLIITSLEAAPFIIFPTWLTIFFFTVFQSDYKNLSSIDKIRKLFNLAKHFLIGIAISTGTLGLSIWSWYAAQSKSGLGEHPGNWIAKPEFILQWSGLLPALPLSPLEGRWELTNLPYSFLAFGTILVTLITLILLIKIILDRRRDSSIVFEYSTSHFAIFAFTFCGVISQIFFGTLGKGYAMLKVTDYYIFQFPLLTGWLLAYLIENRQLLLRIVYLWIAGLFICIHLGLSFADKGSIFKGYISNINSRVHLSDFVLDANSTNNIQGVRGDFCGFFANLFLYMNRSSPVAIIPDSNRYVLPRANRYISPRDMNLYTSHIFRLNAQEFGDINHPIIQKPLKTKEILKSEGYVMICNDIGTNWLPPHGEKVFLRWLSKVGEFKIFGPIRQETARLTIELFEPGPDLLPDSKVQVAIEGKVVVEVAAKEIPKVIVVEIPKENLSKDVINGKIIVKPQGQGLLEVGIGKIFTK